MSASARWHIKQNICATCLSQNRKMFRFCDLKRQMKYLTPADFALCASDDMVCWECKAHLRKMSSFRARAATAQAVLRTLVRGKDIRSLKSLSSIKIARFPPRAIVPQIQTIKKTVVPVPHQNTKQKTNQDVLFVEVPPLNKRPKIKEEIDIDESLIDESEIKKEIENQDDISMDQNIFASELDILEGFNLSTDLDVTGQPVADEVNKKGPCSSKLTGGQEIGKQQTGGQEIGKQQTDGQEIGKQQTGGQEIGKQQTGGQEIGKQQTGGQEIFGSQQKGGQQVAKEISSQQIGGRGEKRTIDSDSNSTDSENEYDPPVEVTPSARLSVGDTYKLKFGSEVKDIFTVNTINHQELIDLRTKRATSKLFVKCKWKCESCLLNLMTEKAVEEHALLHKQKEKYVCDICTLTYGSEVALNQHRGYHYRLYKCCSCEYSSINAELVMRHYTIHHEARNKTCRHCHMKFTNYHKYKLHYRKAHVKRVKCEKCEKHFSSKHSMEHHLLLTHGEVSMVECPICHRKYKGEWNVQNHIKKIHERDVSKKDESAYCAKCDKHFSFTTSYKAHLKYSLAHNNSGKDFKYQCEICEKKFFSSFMLKQHTASVHLDDVNYPCEICEEKFKTQKQRRNHVRRKHEGFVMPKNIICEICSKAFSSLAILRDHLNMHKGERPYVCDICGDSFAFKAALFNHRRLKHKIPRLKDLDKEKKNKTENVNTMTDRDESTRSENSNFSVE